MSEWNEAIQKMQSATSIPAREEAVARLIYEAFGYSYAGAITDIHGKPMGAWRDALRAANAVLSAPPVGGGVDAPVVEADGFAAGVEAAARLIEQHELLHTSDGDVTRPRTEGNRAGLGYVAGIRALAPPPAPLTPSGASVEAPKTTRLPFAWAWQDDDLVWQATCDEDRAHHSARVKGYEVVDLYRDDSLAPLPTLSGASVAAADREFAERVLAAAVEGAKVAEVCAALATKYDGKGNAEAANWTPPVSHRVAAAYEGHLKRIADAIASLAPALTPVQTASVEAVARFVEKFRYWQGSNDLADARTKEWLASAIRRQFASLTPAPTLSDRQDRLDVAFRESMDIAPFSPSPSPASAPSPTGGAYRCAICGGEQDNDALSDICRTCEETAPWRDVPANPSPAGGVREALEDKIEGLEADLDSAVEVAFKRGAVEWTRLNYPKHYERLATLSSATPEPALAGGVRVSLLRHCATCNARWNLFPPVKIDGSDHYRCVECKAVYPSFALEASLRAHPATGEKEVEP